MRQNLDRALGYIFADEGFVVNRSAGEPGGISKLGVSLVAYADYCRRKHLPSPTAPDIVNLTMPQARDFYTFMFVAPTRFDDLPTGIDYRLLDIAVNIGITGGIHLLLAVLDRPPAAAIDDDAIKAVATTCATRPGAAELVAALSAAWLLKKQESPSWPKFGRGWTNRCNDATKKALAMIEPAP